MSLVCTYQCPESDTVGVVFIYGYPAMRYVNYHSYQSVKNVLVYRYPAIEIYVKYHFRCGNIYVTG